MMIRGLLSEGAMHFLVLPVSVSLHTAGIYISISTPVLQFIPMRAL